MVVLVMLMVDQMLMENLITKVDQTETALTDKLQMLVTDQWTHDHLQLKMKIL